eukprot:811466-Amphidinium_carterae.1
MHSTNKPCKGVGKVLFLSILSPVACHTLLSAPFSVGDNADARALMSDLRVPPLQPSACPCILCRANA